MTQTIVLTDRSVTPLLLFSSYLLIELVQNTWCAQIAVGILQQRHARPHARTSQNGRYESTMTRQRDTGILLHDFIQVAGGAERTSQVFCREFDADLCVAQLNHDALVRLGGLDADVTDLGVRTHWAPLRALRCLHAFQTRTAFARRYDWAMYSGFYAPMAVHQRPGQRNLYYCHALPRFAYDLEDHYLEQLSLPVRPLFRRFTAHVRARYGKAIGRMDRIAANSRTVAERLRRYLGIEAEVIHPPLDTAGLQWMPAEGYYLSTARLEPLKRVDDIVRAFLGMPNQRLVVASGGSQENKLRSLAGQAPNITFTGWLDDVAMKNLINRCIATIYLPRDEDFGLSPLESMAAGKPVIGVAEGGLLETIIPRSTGTLLPKQYGTTDLQSALREMPPVRAEAMRYTCEQRSTEFHTTSYIRNIQGFIAHSPQTRGADLNN
jgi:glycosyltransferase involved in cell wall biosynthesis